MLLGPHWAHRWILTSGPRAPRGSGSAMQLVAWRGARLAWAHFEEVPATIGAQFLRLRHKGNRRYAISYLKFAVFWLVLVGSGWFWLVLIQRPSAAIANGGEIQLSAAFL